MDLNSLDSEDIPQRYDAEFSRMPDVDLLAACASTICRPRSNPDSFSLHAPLELLARYLLSSVAPPANMPAARIRMLMVAAQYAEGGEFQDVPIEARSASPGELRQAIENGDVVAADACSANLSRELDDISLRQVFAPLASERLGGAGHTPILLNYVGRLSTIGARQVQCLVRNFARALAVDPKQKISWHHRQDFSLAPASDGDLVDRLCEAVRTTKLAETEPPGGIFGLVDAAERAEALAKQLDFMVGVDWRNPVLRMHAGTALSRMAALGMLCEPETHAKYGWTHCLTLPQAAWLAASYTDEPSHSMALAGSFVIGMRRGLAKNDWNAPQIGRRERSADDLHAALRHGPEEAQAVGLELRPEEMRAAFACLAVKASARSDAHLVKYTLACIDAAALDPGSDCLYLAAAAKLNAIWLRDEPEPVVNAYLGSISAGATFSTSPLVGEVARSDGEA